LSDVSTAFSIPELLLPLIAIILGGGAAALTGRAIAATWRPGWQVAVYSLILAGAARFIHFSLFGGTLLSPHYYLADSLFCAAFAFAGFRATRASQMVNQYRWLNESAGLMRWRRKQP
jgi:hypothetical protein